MNSTAWIQRKTYLVIFNLFSRVVLLARDMEDKREAFLY